MCEMSGGITLRPCTARDIDAVLDLQKAWTHEGITHGYQAATRELLATAVGPYFVVADRGGELVGFVCGIVSISEGTAVSARGEPCLSIEDLYVRPDLRGGGLGGRLLEQVLAAAKAEGVAKCMVYSATKDVRRVMSFYERHGFSAWFVQMVRPL